MQSNQIQARYIFQSQLLTTVTTTTPKTKATAWLTLHPLRRTARSFLLIDMAVLYELLATYLALMVVATEILRDLVKKAVSIHLDVLYRVTLPLRKALCLLPLFHVSFLRATLVALVVGRLCSICPSKGATSARSKYLVARVRKFAGQACSSPVGLSLLCFTTATSIQVSFLLECSSAPLCDNGWVASHNECCACAESSTSEVAFVFRHQSSSTAYTTHKYWRLSL